MLSALIKCGRNSANRRHGSSFHAIPRVATTNKLAQGRLRPAQPIRFPLERQPQQPIAPLSLVERSRVKGSTPHRWSNRTATTARREQTVGVGDTERLKPGAPHYLHELTAAVTARGAKRHVMWPKQPGMRADRAATSHRRAAGQRTGSGPTHARHRCAVDPQHPAPDQRKGACRKGQMQETGCLAPAASAERLGAKVSASWRKSETESPGERDALRQVRRQTPPHRQPSSSNGPRGSSSRPASPGWLRSCQGSNHHRVRRIK